MTQILNMSSYNRNSEYEPIGESTYQYLRNPAQDNASFIIVGFKKDQQCALLYYVLNVFLVGIPYAMLTWFPAYKKIVYKKSPLIYADIILINDNFGNYKWVDVIVESTDLPDKGVADLKIFNYQFSKYIWHLEKGCFVILEEFMPKMTLEEILEYSHGLLENEQAKLLKLYGFNTIEVQVKSYYRLFIEEVFHPFYIFQAFSVILWFFDDYMIYAGCVLVLTIFSIVTALLQNRKQSLALHNLVQTSNSSQVEILRRQLISNTPTSIDSKNLVPGELLVIPRSGCIMPCDAVLLTGNCIVNESVLTGECVPVLKTPPNASSDVYNINTHKAHTLYSGTCVVQGRFYGEEHILARVVKTGFDTTKGSLVKSIMFPSPVDFKFYKDSLKFVFCLFFIASFGMVYCLYVYIQRNADLREAIIRALDIITIVVPPALPAAMTVGIVYSQHRLKKLGIFCISPSRINISGKLKLACFDKTGTLTHDGLELYSILACYNKRFDDATTDVLMLDNNSPFIQAMATCHSLTRIDGRLNGDPLDLNMFENTKWELEEPGNEETNYDMLAPTIVKPIQKYISHSKLNNLGGDMEIPYEIGIIRQFQFSSTLQRMSVICRVLGSPNMLIFTKGAPEKVKTMCKEETVPPDFNCQLAQFTAQGFRVIAVAYKQLPNKFKWKQAQKVNRETIECDLNFLGFIVMQNTLKPETTPVIQTLQAANVRTVMITGDNVMTAICVARECGMVKINDNVILLQVQQGEGIPIISLERIGNTNSSNHVISFDEDHYHFALDGEVWSTLRTHYPDILPKLLLRTTVFARFQPDQKTQLISALQSLDYIVSMVGDGANDCGALKAAHIGISLSQAEASVAAPFTSSIDNISCLIHLILEGRCALVTSFAVFKYMALYSLIQFFTIIILYKNNSILGDQQFLFIDLIITTSLAVTIGRQGPSNRLVAKRPMGSLIAGSNLIPLVFQIVACALTQYLAFYYLTVQEWYKPNQQEKDEIVLCWENTVLFTVSCYQYVVLALMYSKGKPYREVLINNFWLLFCSLTLISFTTYLGIYPAKFVANFFEIIYLPLNQSSLQRTFKDTLMLFPLAHLCIAMFIEFGIAESKWLKKVVHCIQRKTQPKNHYKKLAQEADFSSWFRFENETSYINITMNDER